MGLRQILRKKRRALSESARETAAYGVFSQFLKLAFLHKLQRIAVYKAFDGEIDPVFIINWCFEHQKRCYLPTLVTENVHPILQFVEYQQNSLLTFNRLNILEPEVQAGGEILTPEHLELILLPLVAFDRQGHRLGMGKGFYDRTLATIHHIPPPPLASTLFARKGGGIRPVLLGIGYDFQCVESIVPHENDVQMDGILTDTEMILPER